MIVVDTNILIYYMIEGEKTDLARKVKEHDPEWIVPPLWKHEFINVLAVIHTQKQKQGKDFSQYRLIWNNALELFSESEISVDMSQALDLAVRSKVSAYDAPFVALAKELDLKLVTADREILRKFPETAVSMEDFTKDSGFTLVREKRAGYGAKAKAERQSRKA
jgi:predicted nucleic acid-binding protein